MVRKTWQSFFFFFLEKSGVGGLRLKHIFYEGLVGSFEEKIERQTVVFQFEKQNSNSSWRDDTQFIKKIQSKCRQELKRNAI